MGAAQIDPAGRIGQAVAGYGLGRVTPAQDHRRVKEGDALGQALQ